MANPPITIGPFTNTPAPGSAIQSAWPQEISTVVTEMLRRFPIVYYGTSNAGTSGGNLGNMQTVTFPATPVAGQAIVWSFLRADFTGGTSYEISMRLESPLTVLAKRVFTGAQVAAAQSPQYITMQAAIPVPAGAARTVTVRGDGSATVQVYSGTASRMEALFVPDPYTPT